MPDIFIDDASSNFAVTGVDWISFPGGANEYDGSEYYRFCLQDDGAAIYTATGLAVGHYRVSAHWQAWPNRVTQAPFYVYDNTTQIATALVNQQVANSQHLDPVSGLYFDDIAASVLISSGTLVVKLIDDSYMLPATTNVCIADCIWIEGPLEAGSTTVASPLVEVSVGLPNHSKGQWQVDNGANYMPLGVGPDGSIMTASSTQPLGLGWTQNPSLRTVTCMAAITGSTAATGPITAWGAPTSSRSRPFLEPRQASIRLPTPR